MNIKNFEFEIKDVSEAGTIKGYASTFRGKADSYGDIIEEGAFSETIAKRGRNGNGIPLLWQHNPEEPLGLFTEMSENSKGLKVSADLAMEVQRAKEAYALAKKGILNSFSIGWDFIRDKSGRPVEGSYETLDVEKGTRLLKRLELWEVSLVTFPANTNATITQVKELFKEGVTERQLERGLHAMGLTHGACKFIIGKLDKRYFVREGKMKDDELLNIMENTFRNSNDFEKELLDITKILN